MLHSANQARFGSRRRTAISFVWLGCALLGCASVLVGNCGCQPLRVSTALDRWRPSNDRDWKPEQAVLPFAEIDGSHYTLRNVRDCEYLSAENFVVKYLDRSLDLSQIQTVDFVVVPFKRGSALAHTMLSFGMDDGSYLGVSVEVRKEKGETYNPLAGMVNKYELMYVVGEERDLIPLRTEHYDCDVYVFPTKAQPQQAQQLFADMMGRLNKLAAEPEFYHSITNNCTSNIKDHVNKISPHRIRENAWQVLLPGFSAEYAHQIGLVENRIPYEDLESIAYVNERVKANLNDPNFSQAIRGNRYLIDRAIVRQHQRQSTLHPGQRTAVADRGTPWLAR